jgi:hypothetical protein
MCTVPRLRLKLAVTFSIGLAPVATEIMPRVVVALT